MIKRLTLLAFISLICSNCKAQKETLWDNFKRAKQNNTEPILPDFSYSGYKYSEVEIPTVNYKLFNVVSFGANPNDTNSDKEAINKAIAAATKNGEGIIYFPKGKYYINTDSDDNSIINIKASKIVFRGEDRDASILYFENYLPAKDPKKLWTSPSAIKVDTKTKGRRITKIVEDAKRETKLIKVDDASKIKKGDWITIEVLNNDTDFVKQDLYPLKLEPKWKNIINKGVKVNEHHQVASVEGNTITLVEPLYYSIEAKYNWSVREFNHLHHVGFENLTLEGNWKENFKHHKNAIHDGGWSILKISHVVNSWMKDITFKNVNRAASFNASASSTAINVLVEGNIGHNALYAAGSTGILIANSNDAAGMFHSFGVAGGSNINTVIWRSKYAKHTSFESHASQPRNTLIDNVEGGFMKGRAGGALSNLPNHGRYLVLWNYNEIDEAEEDFKFVATDSWYWRIVPPIIVGFHGSGTTFNKDQVEYLEDIGKSANPESLFEAQLELRLGELPNWIKNIKKQHN